MSFRFFQLILCAMLLVCGGCNSKSGNLGEVEGIVTVDGKPIDRATIQFHPTTGRTSIGYTDDNGHYSLVYTRTANGALLGAHKVTISTELEPDYLGGATTEARKESMPAKYLDKNTTDLTANVERGSNKINFELKSADF